MDETSLMNEIDDFMKKYPPKHRPDKEEIENLILENVELLLDIKKEHSKKKNKNTESSSQYNLVSKLERNLIKLSKVAPKVLCEPTQAKTNKNILNKFIRKRR